MPFFKQDKPFKVPTTDGKLIEEHFGIASTKNENVSIAHMIAPPRWSEPFQNPEFDEYTFIIKGKKMFEVDGEKIIVNEGESILVKKGSRVRYSNPFDEPCEYCSICIPAFSIEKVHREESR
jgi:mannose-6-phosphate isomerase-like protein (cupin superfamily)